MMLQSSWQGKVGKWVKYTDADFSVGLGAARCSNSDGGGLTASECLANEDDSEDNKDDEEDNDEAEERDDEEDSDEAEERDEDEDDDEDKDRDDNDNELDKRVLSVPPTLLSATILRGRAAQDPLPSLTTTLTS